VTIWTLSKYAQQNISKPLLECLAITVFVVVFDAKAFSDAESWKRCVDGSKKIFSSTGEPTDNVAVKYLTTSTAYIS